MKERGKEREKREKKQMKREKNIIPYTSPVGLSDVIDALWQGRWGEGYG
jgi:hypothetical protein